MGEKTTRAISVQDLTYLYAYHNFDVEPDIETIREICRDICKLISNGYCATDIVQRIKGSTQHTPVLDLMRSKDGKHNIIDPYRFYYHNQLRIVPDVIVSELATEEDNLLVDESEKFFLEMKATYTIDNLIHYYYGLLSTDTSLLQYKEQQRVFGWLLKQHDLDLLLYMVDEFVEDILGKHKEVPLNPFDASRFIIKARDNLMAKRAEAKESDYDRIIPRERLLTYGSRSKN